MPKLKISEKFCYATGDLACGIMLQSVTYFLLYFYTDVFGISAIAAANVILTARIWDAINDPIMGVIADHTNTRFGRFRPYVLFGGIALCILSILMYTTPELSYTNKIIYAVVTYNLFNMAYTATNMPYSALSSVITKDPNERSVLASWRMAFAFTGGLLSLTLIPELTQLFSNKQDAYKYINIGLAIFGLILLVITFFGTKEKYNTSTSESIKYSIKDLVSIIKMNKPFLILIAAYFFASSSFGARAAVTVYYLNNIASVKDISFLSFSFNFSSFYFFISLVVTILGIICSNFIFKNTSKRKAYIVATLVTALGYLAMYFTDNSISGLLITTIIVSFATGPIMVLNWSMLPDTTDFIEKKIKIPCQGIFFALFLFVYKSSLALGGAFVGYMLSAFGYEAGSELTSATLGVINTMFCVVPGVAGFISIAFMSFYPKNINNFKA